MKARDPVSVAPPGRLGRAVAQGLELVWDRVVFGDTPELEKLVALVDPAGAIETVHWGRNYLWRATTIDQHAATLDLVVKQFRHDRWRAAWRRRHEGSKAFKSWRMAWTLIAGEFPTPAPVLLAESLDPSGPSAYVCQRVDGFEEVRYLMRRWNLGEATSPDANTVLAAIGELARRLHDAGIWHRDFSAGNVLVGPSSGGQPALCVLDLNRARHLGRVSRTQRMRDLARLPAHLEQHRELLRQAYFAPAPVAGADRLRHELFFRTFHGRHQLKQTLRGGVKGRGWLGLIKARSSYPHLAPPPSGAATRDRSVWDPLSDQPHHHASPLAKLGVRLADGADHGRTIAAAAWALPRVVMRTRALLAAPRQATLDGIGIAVRPQANLQDLLGAVEGLGCRHVALRVHPWESDHRAEVEVAESLAARGHQLLVAVPQNRELVRDRGRWRGKLVELAELLGPYAQTFQIGQAINRSKWGVWTLGEYLELAADAAEILRAAIPGVQIVGPAVIDFEPHMAIAAVQRHCRGLHFDALGSLLYVDRRGAPENPQLGYDAEGKAAFMRAIAETSRTCSPRSWITEVNWPLREGPHSPAGRSVSVDEESQADYLVRYILLTHGSGFAQRVYWWQLAAKGYGLIDPSGEGVGPAGEAIGRRRPSYRALATLVRELGGARRIADLSAASSAPPAGMPARTMVFERDGRSIVVAWSSEGRTSLDLPAVPRRVVDRDGHSLAIEGPRLELGPSVVYAELPDAAATGDTMDSRFPEAVT